MNTIVSRLLRPRTDRERAARERLVHSDDQNRQSVLVELQINRGDLASNACLKFMRLFKDVFAGKDSRPPAPIRISTLYMKTRLDP